MIFPMWRVYCAILLAMPIILRPGMAVGASVDVLPGTAELESVDYMVYGHGRMLCRDYVNARKQANAGQYLQLNYFRQWMAGYMSGYNRYLLQGTGTIARQGDEKEIESAVEAYCTRQPEDNFALAVSAILTSRKGGN